MQYNVLFSEYYLYGLLFSCNSRNTPSRRRLPREQRQRNQYIFIQFFMCIEFKLISFGLAARKRAQTLSCPCESNILFLTLTHTHTHTHFARRRWQHGMNWFSGWCLDTPHVNNKSRKRIGWISSGVSDFAALTDFTFLACFANTYEMSTPHYSRPHQMSRESDNRLIFYARAHITIWTVMNRKNEMEIKFCAANCERKAPENESTTTTHETRA